MRHALLALLILAMPATAADLYGKHCAVCHGAQRLGGMGPALLPDNLARLKKPDAARVIRDSRPGVQMPAFGGTLTEAEIARLVAFIYAPLAQAPTWGEADIRSSREVHRAAPRLTRPRHDADPLNLFLVVESGDHHVSILDGDRLEVITRFASRFSLHGGPKFAPGGRFVYFASRDGWISKYDLWALETVAEVRAGINTRNIAVSGDGRYVMVANTLPGNLVLLDADLELVKVLPTGSRVAAVYDATPRRSFVAALRDAPEIWEISYDPKAEPIAAGMVHDYRHKEGEFVAGFLNPRRTKLGQVLEDFFFTPDFSHLVGSRRGAASGQVVHLDVRRAIAAIDLPGLPHLASGISWMRNGRRVMATPNLREGIVSVFDVADWSTVAQVNTLGPGYFLRSHENSRYAWVDSMIGPGGRDTLQVIDKQTLEVVARLTPAPGRTLAHVEFDRYGRHALASLWEDDGAVIVFDAATLKEVKRLPMRRPVGKYNVHNKLMRSEGTSP